MNGAKSMVAKHFLAVFPALHYAMWAYCRTPPLNPVADYRKMPG